MNRMRNATAGSSLSPGRYDARGRRGLPARFGIIAAISCVTPLVAAQTGDDAIQTALRQLVSEVKYEGTPFEDVIADLRKRTGLNIHIQRNDLEANGVESNTPVSLWLRDVPAGRVLDLVLSDLDAETRVTAQVRDGIVVIASAEKNERRNDVRTYVVRDILLRGTDAPHSADRDAKHAWERFRELVDVIRNTIDPDSWRDTGAGDGSIRYVDGQLVVYNHAGVHEQVARLLNAMRASPPATEIDISSISRAGVIDDRVRAALTRPVKRVLHKNAALEAVLRDISLQSGVNIFVRWHDLNANGIELAAPVTVELSNLPAARVLNEILDDVADVRLAYDVDDGVVVVSTREWRDKQLMARLYRLPEVQTAEGWQNLRDVITQTVNPDSWTDNGGIANLAALDNWLVARQTASGHRQLHDLLEQLRLMKPAATRPLQTPASPIAAPNADGAIRPPAGP